MELAYHGSAKLGRMQIHAGILWPFSLRFSFLFHLFGKERFMTSMRARLEETHSGERGYIAAL